MDFEALAELLIPLVFLGVVGGLVALRMLKPYGNRILELIKEIQEDRHQALSETRDMQQIRDRLDTIAERQDFLESLVEHRLDQGEQEKLERMRSRALGSGRGPGGSGGAGGTEGGRSAAEGGGQNGPKETRGAAGGPAAGEPSG